MEIVLRVFQVFLAVGLIGVVLLQRSEGGGLGMGSSGGMGSFMSVRGTANFLTRATAILAFLFMTTCLALALLAPRSTAPKSIFDTQNPAQQRAPLTAPPAEPAQPAPSETPPVGQTPATPAAPTATTPPAAPAPAQQKTPQPGPAQAPKQ